MKWLRSISPDARLFERGLPRKIRTQIWTNRRWPKPLDAQMIEKPLIVSHYSKCNVALFAPVGGVGSIDGGYRIDCE